MPTNNGFQCKRCGHCCTDMSGGYGFTVGEEQVEIWKAEAPYLLDWLLSDGGFGWYDGWIHPRTGEEVFKCPWYRELKHPRFKNKGAHCLIHRHKHQVCRDYPKNIAHAIFTGCKGFNHLTEKEKRPLMQENFLSLLRALAVLLKTVPDQSVRGYMEEREKEKRELVKAMESCFKEIKLC